MDNFKQPTVWKTRVSKRRNTEQILQYIMDENDTFTKLKNLNKPKHKKYEKIYTKHNILL